MYFITLHQCTCGQIKFKMIACPLKFTLVSSILAGDCLCKNSKEENTAENCWLLISPSIKYDIYESVSTVKKIIELTCITVLPIYALCYESVLQ